MSEKHFIMNYYKNADSGIHIQKINDSMEAQKTHSHEYFQIYYVLQGSIVHITKKQTSQLTKGDAFIIPPKHSHSICDPQSALFYTLSFTKESLEPNCKSLALVTQFLNDLNNEGNIHAKVSIKNENLFLVETLMEKLHKEFYEKQIGYSDVIRAYVTVILTILARAHFENAPLTISQSDIRTRIASCIEYVDTNFAEDLKLSDMAKWSMMSKSEFCKQFLNISGTTFQKYLHHARINHSVKLIKNNYKISVLYSLCGYNDFSTFYRNFKKIMGCPPLEYRKIVSRK